MYTVVYERLEVLVVGDISALAVGSRYKPAVTHVGGWAVPTDVRVARTLIPADRNNNRTTGRVYEAERCSDWIDDWEPKLQWDRCRKITWRFSPEMVATTSTAGVVAPNIVYDAA